jgi:hypothetical protein
MSWEPSEYQSATGRQCWRLARRVPFSLEGYEFLKTHSGRWRVFKTIHGAHREAARLNNSSAICQRTTHDPR